jgi:hypothetical protein
MCAKLGAGFNARHTQPRNSRPVKAFIDLAEAGGDTGDSGLDYYIPRDPHKALAAGAVAGIVLGVVCGSALTAGEARCCCAWHECGDRCCGQGVLGGFQCRRSMACSWWPCQMISMLSALVAPLAAHCTASAPPQVQATHTAALARHSLPPCPPGCRRAGAGLEAVAQPPPQGAVLGPVDREHAHDGERVREPV